MTRKLRLSLLLSAALAAATPARAAFQQPLTSARSAALSNAALLGAGDSTAIFNNPAALATMPGRDAYFSYNQLYAGLQGASSMADGFMTFGTPTRYGSLGVGVGTFKAAGLMTERTIALGWGRSYGRLDVGVAGKNLYHSYAAETDPLAAQDPVFANRSARGAFALDFGAIFHASPVVDLGLAVRNANSPDVGLATLDRVPREIQASASYLWKKLGMRLTADVLYRDGGYGAPGDKVVPGVGVEKLLAEGRAAFRVGVSALGASAGVGLKVGHLEFDYALLIKRNLSDGSYGTHMIGLRWRFGGPSKPAHAAAAKPAAADPNAPTAELPAAVTASQGTPEAHE